jgi:hypothetical protein
MLRNCSDKAKEYTMKRWTTVLVVVLLALGSWSCKKEESPSRYDANIDAPPSIAQVPADSGILKDQRKISALAGREETTASPTKSPATPGTKPATPESAPATPETAPATTPTTPATPTTKPATPTADPGKPVAPAADPSKPATPATKSSKPIKTDPAKK